MFTRFASNEIFPGSTARRKIAGSGLKRQRVLKGEWYLWHVGCTGGRSLRTDVEPGAGCQGAAGPSGKRAGRQGSLALSRRWMVLGIYKRNGKPAEPEL